MLLHESLPIDKPIYRPLVGYEIQEYSMFISAALEMLALVTDSCKALVGREMVPAIRPIHMGCTKVTDE
jgi:hypothetical protein